MKGCKISFKVYRMVKHHKIQAKLEVIHKILSELSVLSDFFDFGLG